ncbi:30 kDa heat shock protein [Xylaria bambusicola]|uniref:30 kDa heat shock protein n=1 Tax=Xylaria bambusicola TaxID=326684 RepID=UPI002007CB56|nr:30 kDa heat shock protein [Xylaria bambusicola]KAI0523803.1 30 kDa heat shock protein [Xylaria bambusicola]
MSVFTHHPFYTVHNSNNNNDLGNFGSLIRFIDDWDKTFCQPNSRNGNSPSRQGRRQVQTFTPRFDVKETEQTYELHGELPGVDKKNVEIDFSDPQTIVIRGHSERTYTAGNPPAGLLGDAAMSGAITNEPHNEEEAETRSNKSFQATVEDEKEEGAGAADNDNSTVANTPATTATTATETPKQENAASGEPKHKYWVYERSVGNFSRSFTFSSRVDHEDVKASLDNGILTVVVPKAKKHESRRIAIN